VHPGALRKNFRREIAAELWEERKGRHGDRVREEDFERRKAPRLSTFARGSDEAKALEALTWLEVADDLDSRPVVRKCSGAESQSLDDVPR
jgi:hypothetical protein